MQALPDETTGVAVGTLVRMPSAREIPDSWRRATADHLHEWAKRRFGLKPNGKYKANSRVIAEAAGLTQPSYIQLKNMKGSFGLHLLIQVRDGIKVPLDDLLGLPPLKTTMEIVDEAVDRALALRFPEKPESPPVPTSVSKRKRVE